MKVYELTDEEMDSAVKKKMIEDGFTLAAYELYKTHIGVKTFS